jgi:hypothetical protein
MYVHVRDIDLASVSTIFERILELIVLLVEDPEKNHRPVANH